MDTDRTIKDGIQESNPNAEFIVGCDHAITSVGYASSGKMIAVYSYDHLLDHFYEKYVDEVGDEEEAYERAKATIEAGEFIEGEGTDLPVVVKN